MNDLGACVKCEIGKCIHILETQYIEDRGRRVRGNLLLKIAWLENVR
jgi:hypothetical protein